MPLTKTTALERLLVRLGQIESPKLAPSTTAQEEALRDALDELSRLRPRRLVFESASGSAKRFVLSTTITAAGVSWLDRVSTLEAVAFVSSPNADDEDEELLDETRFTVTTDTAEKDVLFLKAPAGSETLRLRYTRPHALDGLDGETATTFTTQEEFSFLLLATAWVAGWIARRAADMADLSSGSDRQEMEGWARNWRDVYRDLRKQAVERLAPSELSAGGTGYGVEWESSSRLGDADRVSH